MSAPPPLAFISYRRADSSASARWLAQTLARSFGARSVFIDTDAIRMADDWATRIADALAAATLLIVGDERRPKAREACCRASARSTG